MKNDPVYCRKSLTNTYYRRECVCGEVKIVNSGNRHKMCRACTPHGHWSKTHGKSGTRIYWVWAAMKDRCGNLKNKRYADYGGRGIEVCSRWSSFENFYADMGDPPDGMSLDRVDNDHGYSPNNTRWATNDEQARNRRPRKLS